MGRGRVEGGHAEGGGGHLVAGLGGGLLAGLAGAADRLGQGRGAPASARRPLGPPAGPGQPHHAGADQHAGADRGGGRATGRGRRPGGAAPRPGPAAGRAGAAPGQHRAGRRFSRRRPVRRGAPRLELPPPQPRVLPVGAGFRGARWRVARRLPRVPPRGRGRRRLPRARRRHRPPPPHAGGHHRRRIGDAGEVVVQGRQWRRHAGPGGRKLHRPAEQG